MTRIATYVLRIMGPPPVVNDPSFDSEVIDKMGSVLSEIENTINENLPEGYYCKIEDA